MNSRWFRFLPVFLTALWLPVQSLTAFVMPLALLGAPMSAQAVQEVPAVELAMSCHGHGLAADGDSHTAPASSVQDDCQRCDACHLASAGYLPVAQTSPELAGGEHVLSGEAMRELCSRFPEPLDHPPRLTA